MEVAAELYDLVREEMGQYYPQICQDAKVRLVELQDHVLSTYDRKISEYTSKLFSRHVLCFGMSKCLIAPQHPACQPFLCLETLTQLGMLSSLYVLFSSRCKHPTM